MNKLHKKIKKFLRKKQQILTIKSFQYHQVYTFDINYLLTDKDFIKKFNNNYYSIELYQLMKACYMSNSTLHKLSFQTIKNCNVKLKSNISIDFISTHCIGINTPGVLITFDGDVIYNNKKFKYKNIINDGLPQHFYTTNSSEPTLPKIVDIQNISFVI